MHSLRPARGTDLFGACPAASVVPRGGGLILVLSDGLGIFTTTSQAFPGFTSLQPITPPDARVPPLPPPARAHRTAAIVGVQVGRGTVVEVGLPGFGTSLAHNVDAQESSAPLWSGPGALDEQLDGRSGDSGLIASSAATGVAAEVSVTTCWAASCSSKDPPGSRRTRAGGACGRRCSRSREPYGARPTSSACRGSCGGGRSRTQPPSSVRSASGPLMKL